MQYDGAQETVKRKEIEEPGNGQGEPRKCYGAI